jgi:pyrroline-5-carboxylate reductase
MVPPFTLALVGGGNMGEALLRGLLSAGWAAAEQLAVVEVLAPRRAVLEAQFPGVAVLAEMPSAAGAVIAVKPHDVADAVWAAVDHGVSRILSIAAGVTLASLEAAAGSDSRVAIVRAMPNTPALVGQGAAAISAGTHAGRDDLEWADGILSAVGTVVEVAEPLLDAVTGLAGSGPAYLMLIAESLIEAGVLAGLPRPIADALTRQLLVGSAALLAQTGENPAILRANVTSPGGTTAAGLEALEQHGVRAALLSAVKAATLRSKELGQASK